MAGATATIGDILEDPTSIRSPYAMDKNESFTILKDFSFVLGGGGAGFSNSRKLWNWTYTPKHCHSITWDSGDTTGSLANMIDGNLAVYCMYEAAAVPTFTFYARGEYVDV